MLLTGQTLELLYMDGSHTTLLPKPVSPGFAIWSPSERAVMYPNEPQGLAIHPLTGELPFTIPAQSFFAYTWSPDEKYIAFGEDVTTLRLVIVDLNTRARTRTIDGDVGYFRWSPDGSQLALVRGPLGAQHVYLVGPTGSAERDLGIGVRFVWSPDGQHILIQEAVDSSSCQLINLVDNTRTSISIPDTFNLLWSPDNRTLAYIVDNRTLFLTDIATKATIKIEEPVMIGALSWSPDSERVAVMASTSADFGGISIQLSIIQRADGSTQEYSYPNGIIGYQWLK